MTNKKMLRKASTKKLAQLLARWCRCAVVDYEYCEQKRCTEDYWEQWLKEESHEK